MKFSIVIPSYNEKDDVRLSIESAIGQTHPNKEVLVIDDSNDNVSRQIISEYEGRGLRLVLGEDKGCCGAKNLGMKMASGDVVVILNADVKLPIDFLERIEKHYERGADYVLVEASVLNQENVWARYVEMLHRENSKEDKMEWTEGFSCRREAALSIGLIPGDFSVTFCRDWFLGRALNRNGFKKIIDRNIIVTHKAPDTFLEYWRVRKARGRFAALTQSLLLRRPVWLLGLKFLIKETFLFLKILLILPMIWEVKNISRHSNHPLRDFIYFLRPHVILWVAFIFGEWQGMEMSRKYRNKHVLQR